MSLTLEERIILQGIFNTVGRDAFNKACSYYNDVTNKNRSTNHGLMSILDEVYIGLDIFNDTAEKQNVVRLFLLDNINYNDTLEQLQNGTLIEEGIREEEATSSYVANANAAQTWQISAENATLIATLAGIRGLDDDNPDVQELRETCAEYRSADQQELIQNILTQYTFDNNTPLLEIVDSVNRSLSSNQLGMY